MTELLADCAMLWLGMAATVIGLVLGILHLGDARRKLRQRPARADGRPGRVPFRLP